MYGDQGIRGARVPRRLRSEPCICDLNRLFDAFFRNITIQIVSRTVPFLETGTVNGSHLTLKR